MERIDFLRKIGLAILAASVLIPSCKKDEENATKENCKLTGTDDLGPFFVAGTTNIVNLNTKNLAGTIMQMTGKVYSGEGITTTIENAKIEIWHADDKGTYHPEGAGNVSNYSSDQVTLRGFVLTEANGAYAFQSIRPGLYGDRARHIHFKITAPGHQTLITQSYFEGDSRIAQDELSRTAGDCRIVNYTNDGNGGILGQMDFNLKKV